MIVNKKASKFKAQNLKRSILKAQELRGEKSFKSFSKSVPSSSLK
jgi:hypothetical protein